MTGIQMTDTITKTTTKHRPTMTFSVSEALLRKFDQMSMVNIVEAELKIDVSEDMRAAIITASIAPAIPTG